MTIHFSMSAKVTSISRPHERISAADQSQIGSAVVVPFGKECKQQIFEAIRREGLREDMHNIWSAYPNLEEATYRLLSRLTISWPSQEDASQSAVAVATIKAVRAVKRGIEQGERSRSEVVSAYLGGLSSVATDVAAVRVFGCHGTKSQERWSLEDADLGDWVQSNGFDQVKFFPVEELNPNDLAGTRMKLLCSIATTRDVGLVGRAR